MATSYFYVRIIVEHIRLTACVCAAIANFADKSDVYLISWRCFSNVRAPASCIPEVLVPIAAELIRCEGNILVKTESILNLMANR